MLTAARSVIEPEGNNKMEEVFVGESMALPWTTLIVRFFREGTLLEDYKEARKLKISSARFVLIDKDLYKREFLSPLLKCLNPDKSKYVLREIHEGSCGNHSGARSLAKKVLRQGYY
ncbi:UNVERIFIED_CONTAM: hypothetical protein Sradi_2057900 [Sesamum radiatum]|uniref:Reverse transcriptase domain-containing protein n=1 Tax=Sesamum radiatum TaxID=300843 RepID=A0AAW2TKH7_SESRA